MFSRSVFSRWQSTAAIPLRRCALPPRRLFSSAGTSSDALNGRIALVIGGSGSIGKEIARSLSSRGASVAVAGRSKERCDKAVAEINPSQSSQSQSVLFGVECDVTDSKSITKCVESVEAQYRKPIEILVNAHGIVSDDLLIATRDDTRIIQTIQTNLTGTILACRAVLRSLVRAGTGYGRVINIGSVIGRTGGAGQSVYAASKSGLHGLTRSLAAEYGSRGITINTIEAGYIDSGMTQSAFAADPKRKDEIRRQIPIGRFGTPQDVASLAAFLASPTSQYITGQIIGVDGGLRL